METPPGVDGNRRQTRSQTRGTPAPPPAPTPVKKVSLANSNGSSANKGRRGRPPKSATSSSDSEEPIKMETITEAAGESKKEEGKSEQKDVDNKPAVTGSVEAAKTEGSKNTISDSCTVKEMKKSEDDVKKQPVSTEKPKHSVLKPTSVAVSNTATTDKQQAASTESSSGNKPISSNKTTLLVNEVVNNTQSSAATTNKPESATINNHEK